MYISSLNSDTDKIVKSKGMTRQKKKKISRYKKQTPPKLKKTQPTKKSTPQTTEVFTDLEATICQCPGCDALDGKSTKIYQSS